MYKWLIYCLLLLPMLAQAGTRYVTDQFEITLRSGPSGSHTIQQMLNSGTTLTVIARDDNGYTQVRTSRGTEGWVLSRYLMTEPSARNQLVNLGTQLTNTSAEDNIRTQVQAIKNTLKTASERVTTLELENEKLADEIIAIKNISANTLTINAQNKKYSQQLIELEKQINLLLQENHEFSNRKDRDWFIAGALVLFTGLVIGLILTRIQWRKRSRYDSF